MQPLLIPSVELVLLYLPQTIAWGGMAALVAWVFLQVPKRYALKWALWPALIAGTMYTTILFADSLGRPVPGHLPDSFVFNGYRVLSTGSQVTKIEVWTVVNGRSRLYTIPYSAKAQAEFEKDTKALQKGDVITMHRHKGGGNQGNEDAQDEEFDSEFAKHGGQPPKP